jgi:hypothetical protein
VETELSVPSSNYSSAELRSIFKLLPHTKEKFPHKVRFRHCLWDNKTCCQGMRSISPSICTCLKNSSADPCVFSTILLVSLFYFGLVVLMICYIIIQLHAITWLQ